MATTDTGDSATTGGLLVILGIIVALAIGYFVFGLNRVAMNSDDADSITIETTVPPPTIEMAPATQSTGE